MVQIGAAMQPAGQAGAAGVEGRVVVAEAGVAQVPALPPHQRRAMATQPCGQHAVEQVKTLGHGDRQLPQAAHPHQIVGFGLRQQRAQLTHDAVHLLHRFAHAHAAHGNAGQVQGRHHLGRFAAQLGEAAPLHDAEQGLIRLVVHRQAALQPGVGAAAGDRHLAFAGGVGRALIEGHRHIGAQGHLDRHRALGAERDAGAIAGGAKHNAVVVDAVDRPEAEHLEAA